MEQEYITINEFCSSHNISQEFVEALADEGLIKITVVESSTRITTEQLTDLERYTRLRFEMGISPEGIDVVRNLLERMAAMKSEIDYLRSRLSIYE